MFCKTCWRRFEGVLKTSLKRLEYVFKISWWQLQNVLKISWRCLEDIFASRLEDVWARHLEDVLKTSSEDVWLWRIYSSWSGRLENVLKTSSKDEDERQMFAGMLLGYLNWQKGNSILRILIGKKHSRIKLQRLGKVCVWAFRQLVYQINSSKKVFKLKQNFQKLK